MIITATEVVLIQLFSYNVVSKHKIKMKTQNTYGTFISFKSHFYWKQGSPIFSLFRFMECSIYISMFGLSQSFSDTSNLPVLVDAQRLHENGKWILCVSDGAKWLSVRLQTKWLWNRFLLLLLQISRLSRARSSLTFRQL